MKDLGKKKLLLIMGGIIGLVVLIVIILLIYNAIFRGTSYQDIENDVLEAAKKYYSDNSTLLPQNENVTVTTTDTALTAAGYLKSMSELTKDFDGVSCSATVIINNVGGEYRYTPLLDCGDFYSSKTFASYIKSEVSKVYTGEGLYDLNGELVYRGENPDNYVKFSGKTWRIVKVENDNVMLILNERGEKSVWDNRFNTDRNRTDGINDYSVSRIKETLNDMYENNTLLNKDTKKMLIAHNLYTGKRDANDYYNDGSIEKSSYEANQYLGLLPLYDYINGSVDGNCASATTNSCSNYNYLNDYDYSWWTLTADSSSTYKVYRVSDDGTIDAPKASTNSYMRPVLYLASDVLYSSGTGTQTDPFILK